MASDELEKQIQRERKEIEEAPKVPLDTFRPKSSGMAGRCHFCGRMAKNLVPMHDTLPSGQIINQRYIGECCGGHTN